MLGLNVNASLKMALLFMQTECRFFILNSRLAEIPELQEISNANRYKFRPLNWYSCGKEEIQQVLAHPASFPGELDGLLFYHKQTHYTAGYTPLVGWLKVRLLCFGSIFPSTVNNYISNYLKFALVN